MGDPMTPFHVIAGLAEMEREPTIEQTRAGLETTWKLGRRGDRKRQMTDSKIGSAKKLLSGYATQRCSRRSWCFISLGTDM
jgi:DNA invertase Pin-like site-specific DNA recombinase